MITHPGQTHTGIVSAPIFQGKTRGARSECYDFQYRALDGSCTSSGQVDTFATNDLPVPILQRMAGKADRTRYTSYYGTVHLVQTVKQVKPIPATAHDHTRAVSLDISRDNNKAANEYTIVTIAVLMGSVICQGRCSLTHSNKQSEVVRL